MDSHSLAGILQTLLQSQQKATSSGVDKERSAKGCMPASASEEPCGLSVERLGERL